MTDFRVKYDELDWEDLCVPFGAILNGEKFSGIAFQEHSNGIYEELSFQNGIFNGRNFLFDKVKNELVQESFYENGIPINTHFNWFNYNSFKRIHSYFDGKLDSIKIEDKNRNLLLFYDRDSKKFTEWFENGQKSSERELESTDNLYQFKREQYWNKDGIWLMTINDKIDFQFNDIFLLENSDKLDTEQEEKIFIHFSERLLINQLEIGLNFLRKNIKHKNPFFRYQVARLLSNTKDINSVPFLNELRNDNLQPQTKLNIMWDGRGQSKTTEYPISKMAKIAIENIQKNAKGSS